MRQRLPFSAQAATIGIVAVATLAACGSSSRTDSSSTYSQVIPQNVQRHIVKSFGRLAYVPTRLPPGYHYTNHFSYGPTDFGLSFDKRHDHLGYTVREAHCPGGAMHVFRVNGLRIRWSGTYEDQQAWRCVTSGNVSLIVGASRSISGDSALNTPKRVHDALLLARVVANIRHIN